MKKIICIVLAIIMVCSMVPIMASARATKVSYIDADGNEQSIDDFNVVTNETTTLTEGWWVVEYTGEDERLVCENLVCSGNVNLIIEDGAFLVSSGVGGNAGINVTGDNSLTIYGQENQTGILYANGKGESAGIGGNAKESGKNITINGCYVNAYGGSDGGAGIGGGSGDDGFEDGCANGGGINIVINGGYVVAVSGDSGGAGIGSGAKYDKPGLPFIENDGITSVTINGGTVRAYSSMSSLPGIGGTFADIKINGGDVIGMGGCCNGNICVGIGVSRDDIHDKLITGWRSNLTIADNMIIEKSGDSSTWTEITWDDECEGNILMETLHGYDSTARFVRVTEKVVKDEVHYVDENGNGYYVTDYNVVTNETTTLTEGWWVVGETDYKNVSTAGLTCTGVVNLIVEDGAELNATGEDEKAGINVTGTNSLTIYGQTGQTGSICAIGGDYGGAGIGGNSGESGMNITINGCYVNAYGGFCAAGIGGGAGDDGFEDGHANGGGINIVINNGYVSAYAGNWGTGIGSGANYEPFDETMDGGSVENDGITSITINGGTVNAQVGTNLNENCGSLPGIGGLYADIKINGGKVYGIGGTWVGVGVGIGTERDYDKLTGWTSSLTVTDNMLIEKSSDNTTWTRVTWTDACEGNVLKADLCGYQAGARYVRITTHTHEYTELVEEIKATCTTDGSKTYKCSCGDTITEVITATGHDYETTVVAPTCTTEGYTKYQCKNCEDSYIDNVTEKTEHNYEATVIEPNCKHSGYTEYTCKDCGYSYKADYNPGDVFNLHKYGETITINPTCTIGGHTTEKCEVCGYVHTISETDALGHDTIIINQKDATTEETGYTGDTYCTRCEKIIEYGETIEKLEPITEEPTEEDTTEDNTTDSNACPTCGGHHKIPVICNIWCAIKHFFMNLFKVC